MKVLVIHDGPLDHALALTSLIYGLQREYVNPQITWVTSASNGRLFRYAKNIEVVNIRDFNSSEKYDVAISFGGSDTSLLSASQINADALYGIWTTDTPSNNLKDAHKAYSSLYENTETKQNIFQVLFQMANLKWHGEGYNFHYFPRTRERTEYPGIAVRDDRLRSFVKTNLNLDDKRLWHVPIREDPFKQCDEINKCASIITDDAFVMHCSLSLRKRVDFLMHTLPHMKLEFFGNGCCHLVPEQITLDT